MPLSHFSFFFFNDTATTEIYTLSLHDALPIWSNALAGHPDPLFQFNHQPFDYYANYANGTPGQAAHLKDETRSEEHTSDSSHSQISYAVFCLKKKKKNNRRHSIHCE